MVHLDRRNVKRCRCQSSCLVFRFWSFKVNKLEAAPIPSKRRRWEIDVRRCSSRRKPYYVELAKWLPVVHVLRGKILSKAIRTTLVYTAMSRRKLYGSAGVTRRASFCCNAMMLLLWLSRTVYGGIGSILLMGGTMLVDLFVVITEVWLIKTNLAFLRIHGRFFQRDPMHNLNQCRRKQFTKQILQTCKPWWTTLTPLPCFRLALTSNSSFLTRRCLMALTNPFCYS